MPTRVPCTAATMRAAVVDRYAPGVVRVAEVLRPRAGPGEVLVRVQAAAVTSGDARIRGARFPFGFGPFVRLVFGVTRPRGPVLGDTFAGVVEAVGARVDELPRVGRAAQCHPVRDLSTEPARRSRSTSRAGCGAAKK